jgi:hypothetical protein
MEGELVQTGREDVEWEKTASKALSHGEDAHM